MREHFDAVVIGSGQGGTPLCQAMAEHGWKTALVERRYVGGVCTNDGCTPTKTMVASARVAGLARRGAEYGVGCGGLSIDFRRVIERQRELSLSGRRQIEDKLSKQKGLELVYGEASFAEEQPVHGGHALDVQGQHGTTRTLTAERVFLDVGQRPQIPDLRELDSTPYLDSSTILQLSAVPEHLLILGGGYIAVEFAQMFRRFGSAVTVLEHGSQLLEQEDEDIAACMRQILVEDGIHVLLNAKVDQAGGEEGSITLRYEMNDTRCDVRGSHLLVAVGRVPCVEALHLDRAGIELTEKGYVKVNERLETTARGVWALGDVTGGPPFTHTSYDDFRILRTNLLESGSRTTTGRVVPYCVFTDPELGRVGTNEQEARKSGRDVLVATMPMNKVARATEMSETRGMMKVVVEKGTGKLLGAAALGIGGGEIMTQMQIAMIGGLNADVIREAIFVHPVLAEGLHPLLQNLH